MKYHRAIAMLIAVIVSACGSSAPTRYYTLNSVGPVAVGRYRPSGSPVVIEKVVLPAILDRPQLVRRLSANQLDVDELDRWAAPLDNLAQNVLALDLAARMPSGAVIQPGQPIPSGAIRRISVDLTTFEADLAGNVVLRAQWTIETANADSESEPTSHSEYITVQAGTNSADAVAAGMSQALSELADRMAADLGQTDGDYSSNHGNG